MKKSTMDIVAITGMAALGLGMIGLSIGKSVGKSIGKKIINKNEVVTEEVAASETK